MFRRDSTLLADLLAQDLLTKLKISNLPVDPFTIAARHKIICEHNPKLSPGLSGCLIKTGDTFGILYSSRYPSEGFKRFTAAHELGHYFSPGHMDALFGNGQLIHHSSAGFISKDKYEREADAFAAGLLMPRNLFVDAQSRSGQGLAAIESLSSICMTSLTATAIRFARLSDELVAVVCSTGNEVDFAVMSKPLQDLPGISWISKNSRLTPGTATYNFNKDTANVHNGRRLKASTTLGAWFEGGNHLELNEEIVGLGEYGRTLTVLWNDSSGTPSEAEEPDEEEEENILPSQRWRERG